MRHELQDGGWVDCRPVTDLKGADRTAITHYLRVTIAAHADEAGNISAAAAARENITAGELRVKGMIARAVTAWSFTQPVPAIQDSGEMANEGSLEEIGLGPLMEIEDLILPHIRLLMRTPDPKDARSETMSRSNGRSSARAPSPRA